MGGRIPPPKPGALDIYGCCRLPSPVSTLDPLKLAWEGEAECEEGWVGRCTPRSLGE